MPSSSSRASLIRRSFLLVAALGCAAACGSTSPGLRATRSEDLAAATATTTEETSTPGTESVDTGPASTDPTSTGPTSTGPTSTGPTSTDPGMMNLPDNTIPLEGPFPFDANKPPQPFDGLMVATVDDLVQWWGEEMPRVFGTEYVQLAGGVVPAYPERTDYPSPGCFDTYEDVVGNGYYCPTGDYIVWDDTNYAAPNYAGHGSGAITGLMSHEWGHAIQARTGVFDITPALPTVVIELQADCYSGAWFGHIARGESDVLTFTDADIRSGLIDTVLSADPVGTTPDVEGAHGAGFDRVGAFQDGFESGTEKCATYATNPPPITEIGFTPDELQTDADPGDLSYDELIQFIPPDLDQFWQTTLPGSFTSVAFQTFTTAIASGTAPSCPDTQMAANTNPLALFCPATSTVYLDETGAREALTQLGDFGPAYLLATAWAEAAQTALGSTLSGEQRVLFNDCFVGVWAGNLPTELVEGREVSISPGDLDEAVATAIILADDTTDEDVRGDSFAKVDAFRIGVLEGRDGCDENLG